MAFCNPYPIDGDSPPNASVGTVGSTYKIPCTTPDGTVDVFYKSIIVNGNGTSSREWLDGNLVGASVFGLNFLSAGTGWQTTPLAASPGANSIAVSGTEFDALNSNNTILCRGGFLYKPDCILKINEWLDDNGVSIGIGSGWRVATLADFQALEAAVAATVPVTTANSGFKLRTILTNSGATADNRWTVTGATSPPANTLGYAGFNAFSTQ